MLSSLKLLQGLSDMFDAHILRQRTCFICDNGSIWHNPTISHSADNNLADYLTAELGCYSGTPCKP